jgi:predicted ABC-type ATPase
VNILYFSARNPDICIERIGCRVPRGHDVTPDWFAGASGAASPIFLIPRRSDLWRVYEASGTAPRLASKDTR